MYFTQRIVFNLYTNLFKFVNESIYFLVLKVFTNNFMQWWLTYVLVASAGLLYI